MKVGTDGVLLGAWTPLPQEGRILDVGTGSGLIALMAAQRNSRLHVTGIDIDADAVAQAQENVAASPFADRVEVLLCSLQQMASDERCEGLFNAIVCNPPFFEESLLPPDYQRSLARHTDSLPFRELAACVATLLRAGGLFSVILPTACRDDFRLQCFANGLYLSQCCQVLTSMHKPSKRTMMSFRKGTYDEVTSYDLILMENGVKSNDYRRLTHDFYLH